MRVVSIIVMGNVKLMNFGIFRRKIWIVMEIGNLDFVIFWINLNMVLIVMLIDENNFILKRNGLINFVMI